MKYPSLEQVVKATVESKCKQKASFSIFDITTQVRDLINKGEVQIDGFGKGSGNLISHKAVKDIVKNQVLIPKTYVGESKVVDGKRFFMWSPAIADSTTKPADIHIDILDI